MRTMKSVGMFFLEFNVLTLHFWVWHVIVSPDPQCVVREGSHPPHLPNPHPNEPPTRHEAWQQLGSECQPHCGPAAQPVLCAKTRTQMQRIMGFIFSLQ